MFLTPHLYVSLSQCLYAMLTFFVSRIFYKVAQKKQLMFWIFSQWVHFHASRRAMCGGKPTWQISVDRRERVRADCSLINQLDDEWHHYLGQIIKLKLKLSFNYRYLYICCSILLNQGFSKFLRPRTPYRGQISCKLFCCHPSKGSPTPGDPSLRTAVLNKWSS